MNKSLTEILSGQEIPNYIHPFTKLGSADTKEDIEKRILELKEAGIRSMDLEWFDSSNTMGMMQISQFNTDAYWERIGWVANACRENGMTFMIQDAAPFPTGAAEGWFRKQEYAHLNKLYLAEKHMDIAGPAKDGEINIAMRMSALSGAALYSMKPPGVEYPPDKIFAVIAIGRRDGIYDMETAIDLTENVADGRLYWSVPEGSWRLFIIFETYKGGGRDYYMNLLDADSVRILTDALHAPHYEHLKEEIGKTWLGFFYDETEVGNTENYNFDSVLGRSVSMAYDSACLPWSKEMPECCRRIMGEDYRRYLPLLWYEDNDEYHHIRHRYMDIISRLIRKNYNGQVYRWCRERGILYIGHNLEDENSHCRMGCGPVNYFRMQAYQDMAGVDVVGGQIMPKKDFTHSWYASPDGDGEFYHYGLAKLASSEGHISVIKQGRSFCEFLALYGTIAGTKLRRFVMDHLLVNGINNMIPAEPYAAGFSPEYTRQINDYLNRMCHLMNHTKAVIKTAVLYHADGEWFQGDYQYFQKPAGELARHQISYDVIPSDVFGDTDLYATDMSNGLTINGNRYEALIIPATEALTQAVADFLEKAKQVGFPVFFVDRIPDRIAQTGEFVDISYGHRVALDNLAAQVRAVIHADLMTDKYVPWLRYNHTRDADEDFYFLHNEAEAMECEITIQASAPVYRIDMEKLTIREIPVRTCRRLCHRSSIDEGI